MSDTTNVNELLSAAVEEGVISPASMLALDLDDIGAEIEAGLGVHIDDVTASEVLLVTMMPDDSGSIRFAGNTQILREGHNMVVKEVLDGSKQRDGVLLHTRYLNGHILNAYCAIEDATNMDSKNYNPNQGTPLYDQTAVVLATVLTKAQEFAENGVPCRTITLIISDGEDEHSRRHDAAGIAPLVHDMLMAETHIVAAMGIGDNQSLFRRIFAEMGIPDEWILTPGNTPAEIRQAFALFSRSSVRASQGAASFSQTAMGGFGD
jgi:hypothetical protein